MNFTCVYVLTRKKLDKFIKVNKIKNKYILDIRKMMTEEEIDPQAMTEEQRTYLMILIFNKIQKAIDKEKDVYYIPNFDDDFSIRKLLNLRSILEDNPFNVLIFHDEFQKQPEVLDEAFDYLSQFDNSQIIRDY